MAAIDEPAFSRFTAFPDGTLGEDVSLASKLAIATPAHPEVLQDSLLDLGFMENSQTATRTSKIALQWLKECYGDESMPKPSDKHPDTSKRRLSLDLMAGPPDTNSNGPPAPGAPPFHCNACQKPMTLQFFRVRCAECEDFDLCETCFCQGREVQAHRREHYYMPIGPNQFPLFDANWAADEELSLVDAVGKYGFGNWNDVADYISLVTPVSLPVKEKELCERRYFDFHLREVPARKDERDAWPFTSLMKQPDYPAWEIFLNAMKECTEDAPAPSKHHQHPRRGSTGAKHPASELRPTDPTLLAPSNRVKLKHALVNPPSNLPPKVHILGYLSQRGDFELEFDNSAELLIADLEIRDDESPMEKDVKLKTLEAYNVTLDERARRKRMMLEKKIFDQKLQSAIDRLRTPEQKLVYDLLKPLAKYFYPAWSDDKAPLFTSDRKTRPAEGLLTEQELEEIVELILEDRKLVERMQLLTAWKEAGLHTVKEILEDGGKILDRVNAEQQSKQRRRPDTTAGSSGPGTERVDKESLFCAELEMKEAFFKVIKQLLAQKMSPIEFDAFGYKVVDTSGSKGDGGLSVNDFVVQAKIEAFSSDVAKHSSTASSLTESVLQGDGNGVLKSEPSSEVDYRQRSRVGSDSSPRLTSEVDVETSRPPSATTSPPHGSLPNGGFPSSPAQSEEAEEGEIDGDDEDDQSDQQHQQHLHRQGSDSGGGKRHRGDLGGKGEKRIRRASGGLAPLGFSGHPGF